MPIVCPQCRTSAEARPAVPSMGRCTVCGSILGANPGGDDRIFDESGDHGLELDDGSTACPVAFGPYRVLGLIGKGGMGLVYHAVHEETREEVAIKTVRVPKRAMLHRIRREILALARIKHPGLVRIIETGQSDGLPWYAMELLRGQSLQARMHEAQRSHLRFLDALRSESEGGATCADFVLDLGSAGDGPRSDAPAPAETVTIGDDLPLPPPKNETLEDVRLDDPKAATSADLAVNPDETPTLVRIPPTEVASMGAFMAGLDENPTEDHPAEPAPTVPEGPLRDFLVLMSRLCGTLAYLHGQGIVHRDIKPQNVIIRPDGTPVLLDFGLASYFGAGGRESLEVGGKVEGTPEYMSPEQIRGEYVDARADLYSFGCILYEGVTGKVPFRAGTPGGTLRAHVKVPPIPPIDVKSEIPGPLSKLILHLLAKKSGERLGYARDIIAALDRLGCVAPEWLADGSTRDYLYRPGFTGRASTLALMEKQVKRILARPGHCLFLRGQSGVGKTRFIMELARSIDHGGITVITGECLPIGVDGGDADRGPAVRATPLHPFRSFLQMVADCCLERGCDEVARLLGPHGGVLAECEPALANLPGLPEGAAGPPEPEEALQTRLVEALGETLHEFARTTPVVLFLDDLEWADALTLHFLALFHVGVWDHPNVAIVAAYRTEGEGAAIREYHPVFQDATFVDVGPLESDCLGKIVRDMLGSNEVDDRIVAHLARRSDGNPFFVAEYLRAAVAEGFLCRDQAGCWRPRPLRRGDASGMETEILDVAIPLPDSLHELVARRLAGLSDDARQVLQLAAIFGREVDSEMLDAVKLLPESRSLAAVEELLVAQVLEEARDGHFRFVHDKLREIAYEQIPPEPRRRLHRSVALALEARLERREARSRNSSTLAHHWYRSIGDRLLEPEAVDRTIAYLETSTRQAVNAGLPGPAVEFGRAAARLLGVDLPDQPGAIEKALIAERAGIERRLAGRVPARLLDLPTSTDPGADQVVELLLAILPPAFLSNQIRLFALMASKNLALTLEHGAGPLAPSVFGMYALVARIILDEARVARDFADLAVEADRRGDGTQTSDVLFLKAWFVDPWVRPIVEILPDCHRGAEVGMTSGDVLYGCYNHAAIVTLLAASGESLGGVVAQADASLAKVGRRVLIARFHCVLERQFAKALAGLTEGPTSLTDDRFDESTDLGFICRTSNSNQVGFYHVARLKLHYYQGQYAEALKSADEAREFAGSIVGQPAEVDFIVFRALTLLALEDPARLAEARELLTLLNRWRGDSEPNFAHKALLVEAELARSEGRDEDARRSFSDAIESAESAGFQQHAALARDLAARHRLRIGEDPAELRRSAIDGYRAWGASVLADRLEEI